MKTIKQTFENTILINKSRFITKIIPVDSEEACKMALREIKYMYPDASHHCYAYIIHPGKEKANDDREPAKTAGLPMLEALKKNDVVNILAIVVRYFGGVKLGTNGLIKAYSRSVNEALLTSELVVVQNNYHIEMQLSYSEYSKLEEYLKPFTSKANFTINVVLQLVVTEDLFAEFVSYIKNYYVSYRIIETKFE